ncbi:MULTISPECIES: MazG-like family protein [unclassified Streptomyces]|uniref:MazG-like family protein n=1 Tax=unclassified Streptomyces TaxID=2593676 RepID=UPI00068D80DE|nr:MULTISPECIES: MazG-like family protein [unclassified Streptomyces]
MNDQTPPELWTAVDDLWEWLGSVRPVEGREGLLLRILKLSEEVGEVSEAVIGATGQNPRKGVTHSWDDVQAELCDVVITALVALRTLTPDARGVFAQHLERVTRRSLGTAQVPPPATGTATTRGGASDSADAEPH